MFGLKLIFGLVQPCTIKNFFSFTFRARTITNGFIGGKLKLRPLRLRTIFLSGPNKIVLKIKTLLRQLSVRNFQI